MFCAYCGKDVGDNDMFCVACGKPTEYYRQTHASTATAQQRKEGEYQQTAEKPKAEEKQNGSGAKAEDVPMYDYSQIMEQLVAVKPEYYMPKFMNMQYTGKKVSWNWCSFLVPAYWFVYRKLYIYAMGYYILFWILSFMGGLGFVAQILTGLFGNYIYMRNIEGLAVQAKSFKGEERSSYIAKKGGVNKWGVVALMALILVLAVLFLTFAYAIYLYG